MAERKHKHIAEVGLCLRAQAHMSLLFWWEAFNSAIYLITRLSIVALQMQSPYQFLFNKALDYGFLKVFGSACFIGLIIIKNLTH